MGEPHGACALPERGTHPRAPLPARAGTGGDRRRQQPRGDRLPLGELGVSAPAEGSGHPGSGCGHPCRAGVWSGLLGWACLPGCGAPPPPRRPPCPPRALARPGGRTKPACWGLVPSSPTGKASAAPGPGPSPGRPRCYRRNASRAQRPGSLETAPSGPVMGGGPPSATMVRFVWPRPRSTVLCPLQVHSLPEGGGEGLRAAQAEEAGRGRLVECPPGPLGSPGTGGRGHRGPQCAPLPAPHHPGAWLHSMPVSPQ